MLAKLISFFTPKNKAVSIKINKNIALKKELVTVITAYSGNPYMTLYVSGNSTYMYLHNIKHTVKWDSKCNKEMIDFLRDSIKLKENKLKEFCDEKNSE